MGVYVDLYAMVPIWSRPYIPGLVLGCGVYDLYKGLCSCPHMWLYSLGPIYAIYLHYMGSYGVGYVLLCLCWAVGSGRYIQALYHSPYAPLTIVNTLYHSLLAGLYVLSYMFQAWSTSVWGGEGGGGRHNFRC